MEEVKKIPQRSELSMEDTWATEDMYASDEAWEQELTTLDEDQKVLASFAGRLSDGGAVLLSYLEKMEQVNAKAELLANYCMRKSDEDTRVAKSQAMVGKFMSVIVGLSAACSFETPEIMDISEEKMESFYAETQGLERYRRYLTKLRRRKAHILSP